MERFLLTQADHVSKVVEMDLSLQEAYDKAQASKVDGKCTLYYMSYDEYKIMFNKEPKV